MAAAVLILLVCVELAVSVWCVTRFRGVLKEVAMVEKSLDNLSTVLGAWAGGQPVELPKVDDELMQSASQTLSCASKEQLDAAAKLLDSLGLNKDAAE